MYHRAMLICGGMLLLGAVTAFLAIPAKRPTPADDPAKVYCAIAGTPLTQSQTAPEAHQ
jgi:hypothetical protein